VASEEALRRRTLEELVSDERGRSTVVAPLGEILSASYTDWFRVRLLALLRARLLRRLLLAVLRRRARLERRRQQLSPTSMK
jgi:hypothetical protein